MAAFQPKAYQQSVLDSIEAYFRACHDCGDANRAFYDTTLRLWGIGSRYQPIEGFSAGMPYFCLRVPTGGGKTWIAARSVQLVNSQLLRTEHSVILWLVPSNAIREQTLKALRNREHPWHAALRETGAVTVLDLDEAKSVTRSTLDTSTTVIVSTVQAFRREDREGLKVYESNGALMPHFEGLNAEQRANLLRDGETTPYSFGNVLRLRRPFLIVDEAHNSRTPLSFSTFAIFRPSGIMELTATPDRDTTPSNVLHSVSAAELKAEEMIKLPIVLETQPDWQQCLADAIDCRNQLQALAETDRREGAPYLRPIVLIQAERRSHAVETRHADVVRESLVANHGVPAEEIVIATGEQRGLEQIEHEFVQGIADGRCPVKFVITQQALAEGWDCPFAYVLMSLASLHSEKAVEQLLGRILRQPNAKRRANDALNQSYAFVVSDDFAATAQSLRDRLVEGAGFERVAAAEFVRAAAPEQHLLPGGSPALVALPVVIRAESLDPAGLTGTLKEKVALDKATNTLMLHELLTPAETRRLIAATRDEATRAAVVGGIEEMQRRAVVSLLTPAEENRRLLVPQLALRVQGELVLFDDPEVLDYPWDLSIYNADPTNDQLARLDALLRVAERGIVDTDEKGHIVTAFIPTLEHDIAVAYTPEHWDEVRLAAWLCRNLPDTSATHASKWAFVTRWLGGLLRTQRYDLARANRQKFHIRDLLEVEIRRLRLEAVRQAYQQTLFGDERSERVSVDASLPYAFHLTAYAPNREYDGQYGWHDFKKHYYRRIGDFDTKPEFECAIHLDNWAQEGRIEFWVRNLIRKEGCSFFFQKADGRFYPDFLCQLPGGVVLAVEYKGEDRWSLPESEEDRRIGALWEEMSEGRCRFVMVTNRNWTAIEQKLDR